jgi:hypothetical protein
MLMEDRIQINGVWYKREDPKIETPEYEINDLNVTKHLSYIFESTDFCFEAIRLYKDEGETFFNSIDIEFTDKRFIPWKTEYWDNPNWFKGILDNDPEALNDEEGTIESLGPNGLGQLQGFLAYLRDKKWL